MGLAHTFQAEWRMGVGAVGCELMAGDVARQAREMKSNLCMRMIVIPRLRFLSRGSCALFVESMSADSALKGRILIGEDDHDFAFAVAEILGQAGYLIEFACDGDECVRRARLFRPDLILLDIMMPKAHGVEVLRALRALPETADIGVIICTAKSYKTDLQECEGFGVAGFLVKPFELAELARTVDAFFSNERAELAPMRLGGGARPRPFRPVLDTSHGVMNLWGTRGSTPTPGARFLRHGGNTSCMSLTYGGEHFIFDAGSGIRDLGQELMLGAPRKLNLFVTHTHWDHIQGFPFFMPAYAAGFDITIWGASGFGKDLESVFRGQLDRDYFPVQMEDMHSVLNFRHLPENPVELSQVKVHWEYAQHPGATVGYKIDFGGKKIAWFPDNEFLQGYEGPPEAITRDHPLVTPYRKMIEFVSDVDVLIHEAQYTNDEYPGKVRWGHCCLSNACLLMKFANVPRWIVTHHDPSHDDTFLEQKLSLTRQLLARIGHTMEVQHGYDGMTGLL
jgi:phosphoribosyl 1,2-cyclic phosphodiesterase/ActR/RegA family two-component response regulator